MNTVKKNDYHKTKIACYMGFITQAIAANFAPLLFVLAFIFPFCGVTSTINGYFYGKNNAKIPAVTQIIEQLVRVVFVVSFCSFPLCHNSYLS